MSKFNRTTYFDCVRASLFASAMTQQQVDGQNAILSFWEDSSSETPMEDMRWLAYMLATAFHETATKMWPIEEYGKGKGKEYGVKDPQTGQTYYGRGLVQLTWRENYHNATIELSLTDERDLEYNAHMALDLFISTEIMFRGMAEGWFTNKKLGDYFNATRDDPVNARAIINNDVSKNGNLVAGYHKKFYDALKKSKIREADPAETASVSITVTGDVTLFVNGQLVEVSQK